ncbi:DNA recombination protein RmuC [Candidatus Saccharibacteria bacterium]|nr:DNA recombination protein RmuC [Candidatus Saccharibacteria bacterium]
MIILLIILILVMLIGFVALFFSFNTRLSRNSTQDDTGVSMLKQDLQGMSQLLEQTQASMHERMDRNSLAMQDSVHKQMSESAKLIADVTQRLTKLDETNRRVVDVADELKTLQNVLSNPKQRGVLGEYYLNEILKNAMPPDRYKLQYKFKNGEIVDAVIFLDQGKVLPIDSKFSLENYNRVVDAKDKAHRDVMIKQFKADLKNRIDETSKYIRPDENTMDFAFMFIPSEAIYYDLLVNKVGTIQTSSQNLIEYAFRDKRVIIVSPTSFMAYLQTVLQGLRSLQIEEQAKEIQKRVGQLGKHLINYDEYMHKLGNSLSTSVNHYNTAHKELNKIDKDVVKIASTDPVIEPLVIEKPNLSD